MKKIIVFIVLLLSPIVADGKEIQTTIGEWKGFNGKIKFSIVENNGGQKIHMWVSDNDIIDTNLFIMSKSDLLRLRALIDESLSEIK